MTRLLLVTATVLVLAGCGSTAHTTTITAKRASNQESAMEKCGLSESCLSKLHLPTGDVVTTCGAGLSTNGSCAFAKRVQTVYHQAPAATLSLTFANGTTNPLRCVGSAAQWVCHSLRSAVWVAHKP